LTARRQIAIPIGTRGPHPHTIKNIRTFGEATGVERAQPIKESDDKVIIRDRNHRGHLFGQYQPWPGITSSYRFAGGKRTRRARRDSRRRKYNADMFSWVDVLQWRAKVKLD
jgi:hypothetical protein